MASYRKKPVVIQAFHYDKAASAYVADRLFDWMGTEDVVKHLYGAHGKLYILTLEGRLEITDGDYIIRGVKGEYYPCKPDIFEMTYEKVEE